MKPNTLYGTPVPISKNRTEKRTTSKLILCAIFGIVGFVFLDSLKVNTTSSAIPKSLKEDDDHDDDDEHHEHDHAHTVGDFDAANFQEHLHEMVDDVDVRDKYQWGEDPKWSTILNSKGQTVAGQTEQGQTEQDLVELRKAMDRDPYTFYQCPSEKECELDYDLGEERYVIGIDMVTRSEKIDTYTGTPDIEAEVQHQECDKSKKHCMWFSDAKFYIEPAKDIRNLGISRQLLGNASVMFNVVKASKWRITHIVPNGGTVPKIYEVSFRYPAWTGVPTNEPTKEPTAMPTRRPTGKPTGEPTANPTSAVPTIAQDTLSPVETPTLAPSAMPTKIPTGRPTTERPTASPTTTPCEMKLDLIFVVDESGSTCGDDQEYSYNGLTCKQILKKYNAYPPGNGTKSTEGKIELAPGEWLYKYHAQREFVKLLVRQFAMGDEQDTRVGIVGFSGANGASENIRTGFTYELAAVDTAIDTTRSDGGTYVSTGLDLASSMMHASARSDAKRVIVVLLDGIPSAYDNYANSVVSAKEIATVIAIGYDSGADKKTLESIASVPVGGNLDNGKNPYVYDHILLSETANELKGYRGNGFCELIKKETALASPIQPAEYMLTGPGCSALGDDFAPISTKEQCIEASKKISYSQDIIPTVIGGYKGYPTGCWYYAKPGMERNSKLYFSTVYQPESVSSYVKSICRRTEGGFKITHKKHCGGTDITGKNEGLTQSLQPYGMQSKKDGVKRCRNECAASKTCQGFVWRRTDSVCFWKTDLSPSKMSKEDYSAYDCYTKIVDSLGPAIN